MHDQAPMGPEEPPHADATVPEARKSSRWRGLRDWLWGYDFFISYHWESGGAYAVNLAQRLRERDFDVFLDRFEYAASDDWIVEGQRALRYTQRLIVIGTREALSQSEPVADEIKKFAERNRRIILIYFGTRFSDADRELLPTLQHIPASRLQIQELPENLPNGASDATVKELVRTHDLLRRRSLRARIVGAVLFVLALAAILVGIFWRVEVHALKQTVKADIERQFAEVLQVALTPTSVDQRTKLVILRDEAAHEGFGLLAERITEQIRGIAPATERTFRLEPNTDRVAIALNANGDVLCVAYKHRLEFFNLTKSNPLIETYETSQIPQRSRGEIVSLSTDATGDQFVFELKYDSFAYPEEAGQVVVDLEDPNFRHIYGPGRLILQGWQQEYFVMSHAGKPPSSLGFSRDVTLTSELEDFPGQFNQDHSLRHRVSIITRDQALGVLKDRKNALTKLLTTKTPSARLLAQDVRGRAGIYRVVEPPRHPEEYAVAGPPPELRYPVLFWNDDRITQLDKKTVFQLGRPLSWDDIPEYGPAVLDTRYQVALLRNRVCVFSNDHSVIRSEVAINWQELRSVILTPGATHLYQLFKDGSIECYDVNKKQLINRFSEKNASIMKSVSIATGSVFLLRPNRAVEGWSISAFGPDGQFFGQP